LINTFGKVARYNINVKKINSFSKHTTTHGLRKKSGKQFHSQYLEKKKKNNLGLNLATKAKDLYNENYNPSKKEIEKDTRKWKDCHVHGSAELIL
jgi:hypothetical protein